MDAFIVIALVVLAFILNAIFNQDEVIYQVSKSTDIGIFRKFMIG